MHRSPPVAKTSWFLHAFRPCILRCRITSIGGSFIYCDVYWFGVEAYGAETTDKWWESAPHSIECALAPDGLRMFSRHSKRCSLPPREQYAFSVFTLLFQFRNARLLSLAIGTQAAHTHCLWFLVVIFAVFVPPKINWQTEHFLRIECAACSAHSE